MTNYFSGYNVAVIDASLFLYRLSDSFINELKAVKYVYVAGTFNAEVKELMELMPSRREICEYNLSLINRELHPKEMNLTGYPEYNNDMWDFLRLIASRPNADKAVLVTGSCGLVQRVIVSNLGIDIYDLNQTRLIGHVAYPNLAKQYAVDSDETPVSKKSTDSIGEGSFLYTISGGRVVLGEMLGDGSGSEGNVYFIGDKHVGKIFKTGKLVRNKYRAVEKMIVNKDLQAIEWAKFPVDILYADVQRTQPVGIMERRGVTNGSLYDDELFFGDTENWTSSLLSVKVSDLLCLCLYVTRQVCWLNTVGVYVSDFNIKNFDYPAKGIDRFIQMWDADSFGYANYFSGYMADNDKSKSYDVTKRADVCELCNDELYNFLFQILTLGDTPCDPETGAFKYTSPDYDNYSRKDFVPAPVWSVFETFYTGVRQASLQMMLRIFHEELRARSTSAVPDLCYKDIVNRIDPSFLAEQDSASNGVTSPAMNLNPHGRVVSATEKKPQETDSGLFPPGENALKPPEDPGSETPVPVLPAKKRRHGCLTSVIAVLMIVTLILFIIGRLF